jgi:hypothetical protein
MFTFGMGRFTGEVQHDQSLQCVADKHNYNLIYKQEQILDDVWTYSYHDGSLSYGTQIDYLPSPLKLDILYIKIDTILLSQKRAMGLDNSPNEIIKILHPPKKVYADDNSYKKIHNTRRRYMNMNKNIEQPRSKY